MYKKLGIGLVVSLCLQAAAAEETEGPWNGEGELGFIQTDGNSETQSLTTKLAVGYKRFLWEHMLNLDALRAEDEIQMTAESYGLKWQSDYHFTADGKSSLFGKFRYEDDRFSGYDYQTSAIVGYGYKVFYTAPTLLKLEAGIGVGKSPLQTDVKADDEEMIGYLGLNFSHEIGDNSVFTQKIRTEGGSENIHTESETGFQVNVMKHLAMKLSLSIKNNSQVPADTEKTDTITGVTLVYRF